MARPGHAHFSWPGAYPIWRIFEHRIPGLGWNLPASGYSRLAVLARAYRAVLTLLKSHLPDSESMPASFHAKVLSCPEPYGWHLSTGG